MKIRLGNWLNLAVACIDFAAAIFGFYAGCPINIVIACFCIVAGLWNAFVFLQAVSRWWERAPKVADKFVFTCRNCEHQFIPTFWAWFFVPHIGSRRYLKCEKCEIHSLMRRK
jgi:hypothetical protein